MVMSKRTNMTHRSSLYFLTVIVTFIILTWIHTYHKDENTISKYLEYRSVRDISLDMGTHRLLAKHEYKNEKPTKGLQNKVSYNSDNYKLEKGKGYNETFERLKQGRSNLVDDYLKSYKNRYSKKNALGKLECYCEKLVFDKIDYINKLAKKVQNDKKLYKKEIYNKFGYALIILAIIPFLGLVIPSFFNKYNPYINKWCFSDCQEKHCGKSSAEEGHKDTGYIKSMISKNQWSIITTVNHVFVYISTIFVLFMVIYILIKVIKYERLKAGKGKIKGKDYYRFCKNIFV